MRPFPETPTIEDAPPELFDRGHLWVQELVDGGPLRFALAGSGAIRFGDRTGVFDPDGIPMRCRHAVRHVREQLDREALREAVDDPGSVVFFGVATYYRGVEYDWERLPGFLGTDVWDGSRERFLPPDGVERVFEHLGLVPVNAVAKELRAADFDPDAYEAPGSRWYDGPVAGIVVRNKSGLRARRRLLPRTTVRGEAEAWGSEAASKDSTAADVSAAAVVKRHVSRARLSRIADRVEERGRPVTFDAVFDRTVEAVAREAPVDVSDTGSGVSASALRSALAPVVREFLGSR